MDEKRLRELLVGLKEGRVSVEEALHELVRLPFESLGFAHLDHHRSLRRGVPEAIFGEGKSARQIALLAEKMAARGDNVLVTRIEPEKAEKVKERLPEATYHDQARVLTLTPNPAERLASGYALVVTAGTSDLPVAEEAAITAEFLGTRVERIFDVGVAGLHRLLNHWETLTRAGVVVAVAGMEGALPSVIGGMVGVPVIAVPTSVGYGVGAGGLAALSGMLNSCSPGVAVVNIDNGFGAGVLAHLILKGGGGARGGATGEEG